MWRLLAAASAGVAEAEPPRRLEGLAELPLVDKEMLRRASGASAVRDYLARPRTGSRGCIAPPHERTAMNLALSARDAQETRSSAPRPAASGLGPATASSTASTTGCGWRIYRPCDAGGDGRGGRAVRVGDSELLIRTIRELGITAISCTPSYPAVLERVIAERFPDLRPRDLGLRLGCSAARAGWTIRSSAGAWKRPGHAVRNANYGVTDVFCNFAGQTEADNDLYFMAMDVLHPELIEPGSGRVLPWREGERGELVLTHLSRECQPLVRFRTATSSC